MFDEWWIHLSIPVFLLSAGILVATIVKLVTAVRGAVVLTLPIAALQEFRINDPGKYVLNVEGKRFARFLGNLTLSVLNAGSERPVGEFSVTSLTVSGLSRVRRSVQGFEIAEPGNYLLKIGGPDLVRVPDSGAIVITRPPWANGCANPLHDFLLDSHRRFICWGSVFHWFSSWFSATRQ